MTLFHYWVMTVSAVSLCVSLAALIISWSNVRRSNSAVVRIIDARGYSRGVDSHRFALLIRNLGLPLHEPGVAIRFVRVDGSGSLIFDMQRFSVRDKTKVVGNPEFKKGMVALFELRSETMGELSKTWLATPIRHRIYIDVEAGGFGVTTFQIGGWRDRLASRWNNLAWKINLRFNRVIVTHDGSTRVKKGTVVPLLLNFDFGIHYVVQQITNAANDE